MLPRDSDPRGHDRSTAALGDLLHTDDAAAPVPEKDWVRLVQSIAARDQSALHELYTRAHRIVFTLMVRITNNRETAEEVTLDVFHDVWRRAGTYDAEGGSVIGWILNQARSRAIDRLRFDQRKKRVNPYPETSVPVSPASDPHETLDLSEQSRLLRNALTTLPPAEREAIETAYFSELTHAETAARLDQPLGTIKTRVRSALEKIRQALAKDEGR